MIQFQNGFLSSYLRPNERTEFSCVGASLDYASSVVSAPLNYHTQSLMPGTLSNNYPGYSTWYLYRNNQGRGDGTPNATKNYKKNGAGSFTNMGTGSYSTISMYTGDVVEYMQSDNNGIYGRSYSLFSKRWA